MARYSMRALLCISVVLGTLVPVETWGQLKKRGGPDEHIVAVTLAPVPLQFPLFEVTAELRASSSLGLYAIGGLGSVIHYTTWDLGGGVSYYAIGNFEEGLQLGITVLYLSVSGKDVALGLETTSRAGALVEYFYIGYKYTASFGLTFSGQLGAPVRIQGIGFPNDEGVSSAMTKFSATKVININIGWSF